MHIVHVVRQYAPAIGGLETYVASLTREQRRRGHDVRVVTLDRVFDGDGARLPASETIDGVAVERVAWRGSRRYPLAPGVLRRLGDADLIHVHGVDSLIDMLAASRWLHRTPMILSTHGGFFHTGFAQRLKRLYFATATRWSLMGVRAVLASSVQDRDQFARLWPEATVLVENGVDVDKFRGVASPDAPTIIYFGRIAPNKELPALLRWFAALAAAAPGWRLLVAGKPMGVTIADLAATAATLGIGDAVEFHPTPDDAALRSLIARSSVFACASSYEGFGIAAVEAASAGLLPVLSDIAPFRRTLAHLGFGLTVDFTRSPDPHAFLAAWQAFTAAPPSPELIAQRVAAYAWEGVADRIDRVVDRVLGRTTRRIGPLDIAVLGRDEALATVADAVAAHRPLLVAFANAHTVNTARHDPAFAAALRDALVLNDGIGVEIASRMLYRRPFPANLNGTDFTPALLAALPGPTRVFLVGSAPHVVEEAGRRLTAAHPQVSIVGTQHGFFRPDEEAALTDRIVASEADLVLAAMGNPRQEMWAKAHLDRLGVPVVCVGALFDFTAGVVTRAPAWTRRLRAEWIYRLALEPRRLARRYLLGNPSFLAAVAAQRLRNARGAGD